MGACASRFRARGREGLPPTVIVKEDCACADPNSGGGGPREVVLEGEEDEKEVVVDESGNNKEEWFKDETKRRSLSILFKENDAEKQSGSVTETMMKSDQDEQTDREKLEVAAEEASTGGVVEVEKTEKSIQKDKPGVGEISVAEEDSAKICQDAVKSDEPKSSDMEPELKEETTTQPIPVSEVASATALTEEEEPKANQAVKEIEIDETSREIKVSESGDADIQVMDQDGNRLTVTR